MNEAPTSWLADVAIGVAYAAIAIALLRLARRFEFPLLAVLILGAAIPYVGYGLEVEPLSDLGVALFGVILFLGFALLGALSSPWFLALAWAVHGAWDVAVPVFADVGYMPGWYAPVCLGFDFTVSGYVVGVLRGWLPASTRATGSTS